MTGGSSSTSTDTDTNEPAAATTTVVGMPVGGEVLTLTTQSSTLAPAWGGVLTLTTQSTVNVGVPNSDSLLNLTTQSSSQSPQATITAAPSASSAKAEAASSQSTQYSPETSGSISAGVFAQVTPSTTAQLVVSSSGIAASVDAQLGTGFGSYSVSSPTETSSVAASTTGEAISTQGDGPPSSSASDSAVAALEDLGSGSNNGQTRPVSIFTGGTSTSSHLSAVSAPSPTSTTTIFLSASEIAIPVPVTGFIYFTGTYFLIIIACLLKVSWLVIFACSKMYEPFFQLTQAGGALVDISLLSAFLSTGFPVDHFRMGFTGNGSSWYMIWNTTVLLLLMVLPSICSESFSIRAMGYWSTEAGEHQPCDPAWIVNLQVV